MRNVQCLVLDFRTVDFPALLNGLELPPAAHVSQQAALHLAMERPVGSSVAIVRPVPGLQADAVLLVQSKEDAPAYLAALLKPQDAAELFHLEAAAAVVLDVAGSQASFLEPETLRLAAVRAQLAVHPGQAVAELAQVAAGLERVDFVRLL